MKTWITLAIALAVSTAHREIASLSWLMPYCPSGASPWSPNGELIALYADGGHLGIFDVDGASYSTSPECSPKGSYLAFDRLSGGVSIGAVEFLLQPPR